MDASSASGGYDELTFKSNRQGIKEQQERVSLTKAAERGLRKAFFCKEVICDDIYDSFHSTGLRANTVASGKKRWMLSSDRQRLRPPWASTTCLAMANPRPVPPPARARSAL